MSALTAAFGLVIDRLVVAMLRAWTLCTMHTYTYVYGYSNSNNHFHICTYANIFWIIKIPITMIIIIIMAILSGEGGVGGTMATKLRKKFYFKCVCKNVPPLGKCTGAKRSVGVSQNKNNNGTRSNYQQQVFLSVAQTLLDWIIVIINIIVIFCVRFDDYVTMAKFT